MNPGWVGNFPSDIPQLRAARAYEIRGPYDILTRTLVDSVKREHLFDEAILFANAANTADAPPNKQTCAYVRTAACPSLGAMPLCIGCIEGTSEDYTILARHALRLS